MTLGALVRSGYKDFDKLKKDPVLKRYLETSDAQDIISGKKQMRRPPIFKGDK
jgi:hypothetical protein